MARAIAERNKAAADARRLESALAAANAKLAELSKPKPMDDTARARIRERLQTEPEVVIEEMIAAAEKRAMGEVQSVRAQADAREAMQILQSAPEAKHPEYDARMNQIYEEDIYVGKDANGDGILPRGMSEVRAVKLAQKIYRGQFGSSGGRVIPDAPGGGGGGGAPKAKPGQPSEAEIEAAVNTGNVEQLKKWKAKGFLD